MKQKSILKWSLIILGFIVTFNFGAYAQKTDCSQKTEKEVVIAVYDQLRVDYAEQIPHINLQYNNGVLTVQGYVTNKKYINRIIKLVKKFECVKQVVNQLKFGKTNGCAIGQKDCGGICIGEKETCNVCLGSPKSTGCLTQQ